MTNLLPKSFSKALTACWAGSFLRRPVGPSSLIGPADRAALRPNPPEFSFFICSLSLTSGAALSATLSYPFSPFPHTVGAESPGRARARARWDGRPPGWPGRRATTCARALLRNLQGKEKTPLPLTPRRQGLRQPRPRDHVSSSARASNPLAPSSFAPAPPQPGGLYPEAGPLLATHLPALGFCPLSLFATAREDEKGKWGRRKEERGSEAAP
jgi:hypothetical protein